MSEIDFAPNPAVPGPLRPLVDAFRSVFGAESVGLAGFATFADDPWWFLRHTLDGTRYDLGPLLQSAALRTALPTVTISINPDRFSCFAAVSPLLLAGQLAHCLSAGSADRRRVPVQSAREAAQSFSAEIIGDRCDDVTILSSRIGWSRWFHGDVWDRTWVICDRGTGQVWLLCVTAASPSGPIHPYGR